MGHRFAEIAFTPAVREVQSESGSRAKYAGLDGGETFAHRFGEREADFIAARDSFYMASVSETGWPYVQHRGGPPGFVKVLDDHTLGFADYSGNRQYITTGNLRRDNRVSLFFIDYPNRARLKLFGRVEMIGDDQAERLAALADAHYRARVERGLIIHVEAFDWNCPQHITPRYSEAELEALIAPLRHELDSLRRVVADSPAADSSVLGSGELELVVSGIRQLTPRVRAFELRAADGGELPAVEAGAHLVVPVRLATGEVVSRHYSVASNPARRDVYEIAVLAETSGKGAAPALHASFRLGTCIRVPLPGNHFRLHADARPAVLIAAGIGVTPIMAMAQALDERGTRFELHYAGRSRGEMAFVDRLQRQLGARMHCYAGDQGRRLDVGAVLRRAPSDAMHYVCGPTRLVDEVRAQAAALRIAAQRVRFEQFTTPLRADDRPLRVELVRSGRTLLVGADETILDAMLREGVNLPYSCRVGQCRTCLVEVLDGEVDHRDTALTDTERRSGRRMCACVSRARTDFLSLNI